MNTEPFPLWIYSGEQSSQQRTISCPKIVSKSMTQFLSRRIRKFKSPKEKCDIISLMRFSWKLPKLSNFLVRNRFDLFKAFLPRIAPVCNKLVSCNYNWIVEICLPEISVSCARFFWSCARNFYWLCPNGCPNRCPKFSGTLPEFLPEFKFSKYVLKTIGFQ